jgi:hypothetical protein
MNAIEIEEAISALFDKTCEPETFPVEFLEAFGNKTTTIKRLQSAASLSDIDGAVLLRNNIHLKVCSEGQVATVFNQLKTSSTTVKNKIKFILATDGVTVEAEDLSGDAPLVCDYKDFPNHFGYFLPLAGIETVKQIRDSSFDIRATSRLNRLYIELLKDNPDWGAADNRHEMNHFMARLIFCFFAEDTDIIRGDRLFTTTIEQMSDRDSSNTNQIISEIFRSLNTNIVDRASEKLPRWTEQFPYVNGGLFGGKVDVPRFSKIARSYLLHIGGLDWTKINPDIFGSMIQAVADDEERGSLGMHYTSVPNILKVLNPLLLDELRDQLEAAGDNTRTLLNLRKRIAKIRVFDPACGSGNFLVICYKEMREIENKINILRGEPGRASDISIKNFRGIELRDFPAKIARLALIIAEYQCDLLYRGQKQALDDFLPLDSQNWIICGNALYVDWLGICPPTGTSVKIQADDLFEAPLDQAQIDFENEGGETYICGNPPFKGARKQSRSQKQDMESVFGGGNEYKDCDYVTAWYLKASRYSECEPTDFAFVSTNSISRGEQVEHLWSRLYYAKESIRFCHTQFQWKNNAQNNAGVWCVIIGVTRDNKKKKTIYDSDIQRQVTSISPYLISGDEEYIKKTDIQISKQLPRLLSGNMARDDGNLILTPEEKKVLVDKFPEAASFLRPLIGTTEIRNGNQRWCLWINDDDLDDAILIPQIRDRVSRVKTFREQSSAKTTQGYAKTPHKFAQRCQQNSESIVLPKNTVEGIRYLTPDIRTAEVISTDLAFVCFTNQIWLLGLLSSTLHRVWAEAISGGLGSGIRYSSQLTYNAFPMPDLTDKQKLDLEITGIAILLAREAHFPLAIADLYEPDSMPKDLRDAHERNDEILERIYIGRKFRNDTERLEKLFELYTKMTNIKRITK